MKGIAKDVCPKCKYCLGMTPIGMYSCGKADDGSELSIGIDVVLNCANFEVVNMNKIKGKVSDWCLKCKNCKCVTNQYDGTNIRITEVECEDPYDGMVKTLQTDSDICCSMFKQKEKKKEPCDKISLLQHELEMDKLRRVILQLEKEKASHLKGIERLKKSQEKLQNQVKNLQTTNEESYKREEKLEDKCRKLERRLIKDLTASNENLTKAVEKRDRWVDGLQNDVYTLQNEILTIRDIAQKAYDDTNRD